MKIATWNVNSLNARLPRVLAWLEKSQPDILCLQETKTVDEKFPFDALGVAGYAAAAHGQKTYNGVAILAKKPLACDAISTGIPDFNDEQARVVEASVGDIRVVCVYVPNGQAVGSEKYGYKLQWCRHFTEHLRELVKTYPKLAVCGDFNIAPDDRDVWDVEVWRGQILCSDDERAAFGAMLNTGMKDSFRLFEQPEKSFSWWDYRQLGFARNHGVRIDHILLSPALAAVCVESKIDRDERKGEKPSDHAPAEAVLEQG